MTTSHRAEGCGFIPPHMVEAMSRSSDRRIRKLARHNRATARSMRGARATRVEARGRSDADASGPAADRKHRLILDAGRKANFQGTVRRREGQPRTGDPDVDDAYRNTGIVLDFYREVFARASVDGKGLPLRSNVRFRRNPASPMLGAYWCEGQRVMTYGEEVEHVMKRPTRALDVAGHEITHGVVEFTAGLVYRGEPGALNESIADVMGSLVKQWRKDQTARQADWLIGDEVVFRSRNVRAIRSLREPGNAYRDVPHLGSDPQVAHMKDRDTRSTDDCVHVNSGIPNHAFYLFAMALGGNAWKRAGWVWYDSLLRLRPDSDFAHCAKTTYIVAGIRHGRGSTVQKAVKAAWKAVGLAI